MWAAGGTWERVFTALMARADADQDLNRAVPVDATILRAHQRPAGARTQGAPADARGRPGPRPVPPHIGRLLPGRTAYRRQLPPGPMGDPHASP